MSEPARHATFPLDCDAYDAANNRVREAIANDPNESDANRRIRTDGSDEHYRTMWMDTYIEAGGEYKYTPQKRKLGEPVTTCQAPKPVPETTNLTVNVRRKGDGAHISHANVSIFIEGPDGKVLTRTSDGSGNANFKRITPGHYNIDVTHGNYEDGSQQAEILPNQGNGVWIELTAMPTEFSNLTVSVARRGLGTKPLSGAKVVIQGPRGIRRGTSDKEGNAHFLNVVPGTYSIDASHHDHRDGSTAGKASPTSTSVVPIALEYKWSSMELWFTLDVAALGPVSLSNGDLLMNLDGEHYAFHVHFFGIGWSFGAKGKPPLIPSHFRSISSHDFEYDARLLDPVSEFGGKSMIITLYGKRMDLNIKRALPYSADKDRQFIKGVSGQTLRVRLRSTEFMLGTMVAVETLDKARKFTLTPPPRKDHA